MSGTIKSSRHTTPVSPIEIERRILLVRGFKVLEVLATVCNEAEQSSTRVLVLAVLIEMTRKLLDSACQKGDLYLRGARVGIMTTRFRDFIVLFSLREHGRIVSYSSLIGKGAQYGFRGLI